jgi:PAS domain S-box-containing protein
MTEEESNKKSKNYSFLDKDIILTIDQNCKIIKINDECEKISGYNKDNILNKGFFEILIPERYADQWKNIISKVREDKLIDDFNLPLLSSDGNEIMISWSSFPVRSYEGSVEDIGLVGQIVFGNTVLEEASVNETEFIDVDDAGYFDEFEKVVQELQEKNKELEKENKKLEKKLNKSDSKKSDHIDAEGVVGRGLYRFSNTFGGLKKREELDAYMHELDQREKHLNKLEKKLEAEKQEVNERKNKFIRWREKLEELESNIESRNKWVQNKEKALIKAAESIEEPSVISRVKSEAEKEFDPGDFNSINDCAAIVQRGIFKKVNNSFADLLGYSTDEIIDKSIFDFIDSSGFSGIEQYYFNRLKGEDVSAFETVFLTTGDVKVNVEVNTEPTVFNDEKAEIVVFKKLKLKKD